MQKPVLYPMGDQKKNMFSHIMGRRGIQIQTYEFQINYGNFYFIFSMFCILYYCLYILPFINKNKSKCAFHLSHLQQGKFPVAAPILLRWTWGTGVELVFDIGGISTFRNVTHQFSHFSRSSTLFLWTLFSIPPAKWDHSFSFPSSYTSLFDSISESPIFIDH